MIVALSIAAGLIAAVVLVAMPFIPARENVLTGVVLLAFALGWALPPVLDRVRAADFALLTSHSLRPVMNF